MTILYKLLKYLETYLSDYVYGQVTSVKVPYGVNSKVCSFIINRITSTTNSYLTCRTSLLN